MNDETLANLEAIGNALQKEANKPSNYNTDWAYYLDQMASQITKLSNELRSLDSYLNIYD